MILCIIIYKCVYAQYTYSTYMRTYTFTLFVHWTRKCTTIRREMPMIQTVRFSYGNVCVTSILQLVCFCIFTYAGWELRIVNDLLLCAFSCLHIKREAYWFLADTRSYSAIFIFLTYYLTFKNFKILIQRLKKMRIPKSLLLFVFVFGTSVGEKYGYQIDIKLRHFLPKNDL